jgi:hypothetical protein
MLEVVRTNFTLNLNVQFFITLGSCNKLKINLNPYAKSEIDFETNINILQTYVLIFMRKINNF